ncbi:MAG: DUF6261 family protein [Dysgonamonadaceae bacterium]|jgi:hypothetical protein|nr:DUF6261 family protein [Dysgonamonadaceae bacterium]MDD3356403.1 DUF6261 family protein [Dysgonamonadaceae bacterium]MDD3728323.1 DUF6261 family protein [Dysgonamonadaceae bacterium]MDD4246568.1 DUF6261 family protein [Dysgonamonadaceae bacterium]MDD4606499.1 DUF6261 family protein [Dysgonamonadaceae bacterium]
MKKLHIGFVRELRNSEFAILFNHIFNLMEKEEIENELLKNAWERAKHHSEELRFLRNRPPYHLLTRKIQKLIRTRTDYLISLRLQVEGKMLSHKPEERLAAKRLNVWLRNCKRYLYTPSITTQSALIDHLLVEQEMFPDIQEAITFLNFDDLIEEIAEISDQVNSKFKTRLEDTAANSRKGQELRQAAYKDLKLVVKVMEMLNDMNDNNKEVTQCYQLSLVLGELLKNTHTILKSRTTKKKNKKEVESAVALLINDTKEGSKKNLPMVITAVKEPSKIIEDDTTQLSKN